MRLFKILAGPIVALLIYFWLGHLGAPEMAARMLALVVWVAVWWLTEALELGITSLLPFALMPLLGIMKTEDVARQYMDQIIFLFMGGFFMAYAMEKWNLHERIAFRIIMAVGNTPAKVLFGVMLTAYILSMWVSNTATVMMLIAAVLAIIQQKELYSDGARKPAATAILLGLSFAATIGGMATLVGTPPNMIFLGMYEKTFPGRHDVDFLTWMKLSVPFSITLLAVSYFILKILFIPAKNNIRFDMHFISDKYRKLGKMQYEERIVLCLFGITVFLWFFREDLDLGIFKVPGWSQLFGEYSKYIRDSTVVIVTSFFLFLIPSNNANCALLEWNDVKRLPLNVLLLFGSGFALSEGFEKSGLSTWLATCLHVLQGAPPIVILFGVIVTVTVLSEFASNTASIQLVLPIIIPLSATLGFDPLLLMVTATLSASLGYMLPVATAANTIVYGSNEIDVKDMMKAGIIIDVAGVILLLLFMLTLGKLVYAFNV
jgi:sodium-dependent dicarboxylate transporter 2/3/5